MMGVLNETIYWNKIGIFSFIRIILILLMSNFLQGSRPRKLFKKAKKQSPTFQSQLVNALLQYEPNPQSNNPHKIKEKHSITNSSKLDVQNSYLVNKKSSSTSKIQFDSLHNAEEQFVKLKLRNPDYFSNHKVRDAEQELNLASSRARSSNPYKTDNSLNFKSGVQIRLKQIHGYDIIKNI